MRAITFLLAVIMIIPLMAQDVPPMPVVPTPEQIAYQEQELIGFIHYTVNAFTDKEWGDGKENPAMGAVKCRLVLCDEGVDYATRRSKPFVERSRNELLCRHFDSAQ